MGLIYKNKMYETGRASYVITHMGPLPIVRPPFRKNLPVPSSDFHFGIVSFTTNHFEALSITCCILCPHPTQVDPYTPPLRDQKQTRTRCIMTHYREPMVLTDRKEELLV